MTRLKHVFVASAAALSLHAQATTVALPSNGSWFAFDVDVVAAGSAAWIDAAYSGDFSPLSFSFLISAGHVGVLTVVDGGHAGDNFTLALNGNASYASTSAGTNNFPANVGLDFDAALANADYSRGSFNLGPGAYTLSGSLLLSARDASGSALDATVGGVSLRVNQVPEPSSILLAGLGLLALRLRRA